MGCPTTLFTKRQKKKEKQEKAYRIRLGNIKKEVILNL